MINAVFGKQMENARNRVSIKLTTDHDVAVKYFSKLPFNKSICIDGLYMMQSYKEEIRYDKPVYIGMSIFALSKVTVMNFHYNVIHKNFAGKYDVVYGDTDSLVYYFQHEDIYERIKNNKQYFDLSESLRPDLHDNTNKTKQ